MTRIAALAAFLVIALGLSAAPAQADAPLREGPFPFTFTQDDFFAGSGQSCDFPVTGSWSGTLLFTTFFYPGTEQPARVVTQIDFTGTLSNPLNGKSVADASHHDMITDYFAPDGTFLKERSRTNPGTIPC